MTRDTSHSGVGRLPENIIDTFGKHVPGAIYLYQRFPDGRARVNYISDGIIDIYGYTPEQLYEDVELGHDRIHPEDRPGFEKSIQDCFETLDPWKLEYRVNLPDVGLRHISAAATLERQHDGSVLCIGHLIDITEFRLAQEQIFENAKRYQRAIEEIGDGAWFYDLQTGHLTFSINWWRLLGYEQGEADARLESWLNLIHADDRHEAESALSALFRGDAPSASFECRMRTRSGVQKWVLARGAIIDTTRSGRPRVASGTFTDITERKEAEWRLRLQAQVIESAPTGVFVIDASEQAYPVRYVNAAFCRIYGCSPDDILGKGLGFASKVSDPEEFEKQFRHDLFSAGPSERLWKFVDDDKGASWRKITTAPMDIGTDHARIIGIVEDVTEDLRIRENLARAREDAIAANKAKSNFIAHVSHELRTPLHGIMGLSELGADDVDAPEHTRRQAQEIYQAAEHLLRLISDVIDLSAIEAGRLALSMETVEVQTIVDEVVRLARPVAADNGIHLQVDDRLRQSDCIQADSTRAVQVLLNLVSNGIKYNRADGRVTLRLLEGTSDALRIGVEDTGSGLDDDAVKRLFTPFDRLGRELGAVEGSGIGLIIAKNLAEAMGGTLGLERNPDIGSTFWLELPRAPRSSLTSSASALNRPDSGSREVLLPDRVLIAEDNALCQEVYAKQLEKIGCTAEIVSSGITAWELWHEGDFNVVITDVHMPGIDGYELTRRIRAAEASDRSRRTYVVGASANAMKDASRLAISGGMDDYIAKPIKLQVLSAALEAGAHANREFLAMLQAERGAGALPPSGSDAGNTGAHDRDEQSDADEIGPNRILDDAVLVDMVGEDAEAADILLHKFLDEADSSVIEFNEALQGASFSKLKMIAHRVRGAAMVVGATEFAALCDAIEGAAAAENLGQSRECEARLPAALERVRSTIAARQSSYSGG